MKVTQFEDKKNQFIIETDFGTHFQSYGFIIAYIPIDPLAKYGLIAPIQLDEKYWDYSPTTSKYLFKFLRITGGRKEILDGIQSGKYVLTNLNP